MQRVSDALDIARRQHRGKCLRVQRRLLQGRKPVQRVSDALDVGRRQHLVKCLRVQRGLQQGRKPVQRVRRGYVQVLFGYVVRVLPQLLLLAEREHEPFRLPLQPRILGAGWPDVCHLLCRQVQDVGRGGHLQQLSGGHEFAAGQHTAQCVYVPVRLHWQQRRGGGNLQRMYCRQVQGLGNLLQ